MALRNVVKKGDDILRKKCRPIEKFDDKLATLVEDMIEPCMTPTVSAWPALRLV